MKETITREIHKDNFELICTSISSGTGYRYNYVGFVVDQDTGQKHIVNTGSGSSNFGTEVDDLSLERKLEEIIHQHNVRLKYMVEDKK